MSDRQFLNQFVDKKSKPSKTEVASLKIQVNNLHSITKKHNVIEQRVLLYMDEFIIN